jgi:hypothetical protein
LLFTENLFIVTRDKHAKSGPILSALSVLSSRKIAKSSLQYVSQSGCPTYSGLMGNKLRYIFCITYITQILIPPDEMNRYFNASAVEKIAPNSQLAEIDIRIKAEAPPPAPTSASTSENITSAA